LCHRIQQVYNISREIIVATAGDNRNDQEGSINHNLSFRIYKGKYIIGWPVVWELLTGKFQILNPAYQVILGLI